MSRAQVESILGHPDAVIAGDIVYSRQFQRRSSAEQFEALRRDYPDVLSDAEAHRKFDFYPSDQYIVARFSASKLVYLAVSTEGDVKVE